MRIVIFGGTGQLGQVLQRHLRANGHQVDVVQRGGHDPLRQWDGQHDGPWMKLVDGADAVVNLAGRTVNCRYNWTNLNQMMQSRTDSCQAVGRAIAQANTPPRVWMQASTASIYAHNLGKPFGEDGTIGGQEPNVPPYWAYSVAIARAWELALAAAPTPHTRKVAMRTGYTMSPDKGGIFDWLKWLAGIGFGGPMMGGEQYVSWITGEDWARAVLFCIENDSIEGPVNFAGPKPVRHRELMAHLVEAVGAPIALPVSGWMAKIGAVLLKTDTELMLKSRRVVPTKLLEAAFEFRSNTWPEALEHLMR